MAQWQEGEAMLNFLNELGREHGPARLLHEKPSVPLFLNQLYDD